MPFAHVYFVASTFLLALGAILAKHLLSAGQTSGLYIHPLPLLTLQLGGGLVFLCIARAWRDGPVDPLRLLVRPAYAGLVLGLGSVGTIMALALISASEASVLFATQPVLMLGLAWALLGERVAVCTIVVALCAVAGVVTIIIGGGLEGSTNRAVGFICALVSTACAALYVVWMRGLSGKVDPLTALIVVQSVACLMSALLWAGAAGQGMMPIGIGTQSLLWAAAGTGVIYYGAAFGLYLMGLQTVQASIAGIYLNLVPVFTIGLSYILLGERLTALQWMGAFTVLLSIAAISVLGLHDRTRTQNNR